MACLDITPLLAARPISAELAERLKSGCSIAEEWRGDTLTHPAHFAMTMRSLLSPAADMRSYWLWAAMCQELP
jgi:hypothetical protein